MANGRTSGLPRGVEVASSPGLRGTDVIAVLVSFLLILVAALWPDRSRPPAAPL